MEYILTIGVAVMSILIQAIIDEDKAIKSERRGAKETFLHKIYSAVKDRFGVTQDELDQALSQLDVNLANLAEATRGSARLSKATQIYQDFLSSYPSKVKTINKAKNVISQAINDVSSKEAGRAVEIQNREKVSSLDIQKDLDAPIDAVALEIKNVNDLGGKRVEGANDLAAMKTGTDEKGENIEQQQGKKTVWEKLNDMNIPPINPV